ncbi:cathelicidin-related peptide Pt_CRAMP2-like [Dendropsophus ebraccatus]|uniref:cathelicidin-related peptide Pt_CRAMP2-like n=1 Tax=Dendropsophus ebraccatus TaxID=150705 RepID=UPI003830FE86
MDNYLILGLVLAAIAATHGNTLPTMPWDDDDISVMCLIGTDYYNRVSGESALYRLHGNGTEYSMNEASSFHELHFTIKETICQKLEKEVTDDCEFREDGLVKSCTASFMVEDDRDVIVVTCDIAAQPRSRVRRSRNGGRGNGGRGNSGRGNGGRGNGGSRGGGRAGSGSSIAGGGSRGGGSRGGGRYA